MRKTMIAMLVLGCGAVANAAELKVAVVDPMATIAGTEHYKKAVADLDKDIAGDKARVMKLQGELNTCKQKMGADAATMSATEQARLKTECEAKYGEFQALGQKVNKVMAEREQAVLKDLGPKFQKAVDAIVKEGGYDMVVQREALLFVKPELDISAKVAAKMNAAK